jgi:hypothetical protein
MEEGPQRRLLKEWVEALLTTVSVKTQGTFVVMPEAITLIVKLKEQTVAVQGRAKFETFHWTPGITAAARFSAGAAKTEAARALRKRIGVASILLNWLLLLKVVRWLEQSYLLVVMEGRIERQFEGERYFVHLYHSLDKY